MLEKYILVKFYKHLLQNCIATGVKFRLVSNCDLSYMYEIMLVREVLLKSNLRMTLLLENNK